jgi:hypothetical protein
MDTRSMMTGRAGAILAAMVFCGLGGASAQTPAPTPDCASGPFVVVNLAVKNPDQATSKAFDQVANKAIALPGDAEDLRKELEKYTNLDQLPNNIPDPNEDENLFSTLGKSLDKSNTRWIMGKGTPVTVYVIFNHDQQKVPKVDFTEKERKTRLETDLATLIQLAQKINAAAETTQATPPKSSFAVFKECHSLGRDRSTLGVTATADLKSPASDDTTGPAKGNINVTTGPTEHAFLSADLAVNSINEVKLDSGNLVPTDNPSQFYVGFNLMVGDVLSEETSFWKSLTGKLLIEASKHPTDSWGIAIGTRFKSLNLRLLQLDTFSPWVGYIWNRNDTLKGHEYKGDWRFGISLNLDKALGWVQ